MIDQKFGKVDNEIRIEKLVNAQKEEKADKQYAE